MCTIASSSTSFAQCRWSRHIRRVSIPTHCICRVPPFSPTPPPTSSSTHIIFNGRDVSTGMRKMTPPPSTIRCSPMLRTGSIGSQKLFRIRCGVGHEQLAFEHIQLAHHAFFSVGAFSPEHGLATCSSSVVVVGQMLVRAATANTTSSSRSALMEESGIAKGLR